MAETQTNAISPAFEPALIRAANFSESQIESPLALSGEDDLVLSLSNAYENRRARQVFEWEITRRRAVETNAKTFSLV
ncbi:MAG: hypothetical protein HOP19_13175 [Acidobacteria bacterium]|nr:hypothetical protein [Acidobacteriota bacterium]